MTMTCHFYGGPLDGQLWEKESAPLRITVPQFDGLDKVEDRVIVRPIRYDRVHQWWGGDRQVAIYHAYNPDDK